MGSSWTQQGKKLSHKEVRSYVAKNHPKVKILKIRGGGGRKYPKYRFNHLQLASGMEVAKNAELQLFGVGWEEWEASTKHLKHAQDVVQVRHPDIERAVASFAGR